MDPDETVERVKRLLVERAMRLPGGNVTSLLYLDYPDILRDVYGVEPPSDN